MTGLQDIAQMGVRFVVPQCHDMAALPELQAAYASAVLVDVLHMNPLQVKIQSYYPYARHHAVLKDELAECDQSCLVFFLENFYHSSTYVLREVIDLLKALSHKRVIIQSYKIGEHDALQLMTMFPHVVCVARTDIEYVLHEHLIHKRDLHAIPNMTVRLNHVVTHTQSEPVNYDLGVYLPAAYTNNIAFRDKDCADYIMSMMDDHAKTKHAPLLTYMSDMVMLSTGRGCKYKCTYCFRGAKFSSVRQIPLHVIDADLTHVKRAGMKKVYLYDDCFVTTNKDRLTDVIELLKKHDLLYYIAIRHEVVTPDVMEQLLCLKFFRVQIGLQSTTFHASHKRSFDAVKLANVMTKLNEAGAGTSIDVILGLPGETAQEFMKTVEYAIALNPANIVMNTLFVNPGTELSKTVGEFGIKTRRVNFNVPYVIESSTFSEQDFAQCRQWMADMATHNPHINFILR